MKKANWWQKGTRKWRTVWSASCNAYHRNNITGIQYNVPGTAILKVDEKNEVYHCYITDGNTSTDIEPIIFLTNDPTLKPILDQFNINY